MTNSITVVIGCFNEEKTIRKTVQKALSTLNELQLECEIIIVDDGSTDHSGEIADQLDEEYPEIRVVHHTKNMGVGAVYRTGFTEANQDLVTFISADLQANLSLYLERYLPEFENNADMVIGYIQKRKDPFSSKVFSYLERLIFQILFPGTPVTGQSIMFRRKILDEVKLKLMNNSSRSWVIVWELLIRAYRKGYKIARVPIERRPRVHGKSKGNTLRNAVLQFKALIGLWLILMRES